MGYRVQTLLRELMPPLGVGYNASFRDISNYLEELDMTAFRGKIEYQPLLYGLHKIGYAGEMSEESDKELVTAKYTLRNISKPPVSRRRGTIRQSMKFHSMKGVRGSIIKKPAFGESAKRGSIIKKPAFGESATKPFPGARNISQSAADFNQVSQDVPESRVDRASQTNSKAGKYEAGEVEKENSADAPLNKQASTAADLDENKKMLPNFGEEGMDDTCQTRVHKEVAAWFVQHNWRTKKLRRDFTKYIEESSSINPTANDKYWNTGHAMAKDKY